MYDLKIGFVSAGLVVAVALGSCATGGTNQDAERARAEAERVAAVAAAQADVEATRARMEEEVRAALDAARTAQEVSAVRAEQAMRAALDSTRAQDVRTLATRERALADLQRRLEETRAARTRADRDMTAAAAEIERALRAARSGQDATMERARRAAEVEQRLAETLASRQAASADTSRVMAELAAALERTRVDARDVADREAQLRNELREREREVAARAAELTRAARTAAGDLRRELAEADVRRALAEAEVRRELAEALELREPAFPSDPADSLYRAAREALNGGEYRQAAELFSSLRERFPESLYVPSSLYYEAFARRRMGGEAEMQIAARLMEELYSRDPDFGDPAAGPFGQALAQFEGARYALEGALPLGDTLANAWLFGDTARAGGNFGYTFGDSTVSWESAFGANYFPEAQGEWLAFGGDEHAFGDLGYTVYGPSQHFGTSFDVAMPESPYTSWFVWSERCRGEDAEPELEAMDALRERDPGAFLEAAAAASPTADPCAFEAAAYGLFRLAPRDDAFGAGAREQLARIAVDPEAPERIRERAIQAVRRSDREAGNRLLFDAGMRGDLSASLRLNALRYGMGAATVEEVRGVLADPELEPLHAGSIDRLRTIGDEAAVSLLMEVAGNLDRPASLRTRAIRALARSEDPRVTPFLRRMIGQGGGVIP